MPNKPSVHHPQLEVERGTQLVIAADVSPKLDASDAGFMTECLCCCLPRSWRLHGWLMKPQMQSEPQNSMSLCTCHKLPVTPLLLSTVSSSV